MEEARVSVTQKPIGRTKRLLEAGRKNHVSRIYPRLHETVLGERDAVQILGKPAALDWR